MRRVLISGASIAGPAIAFWLVRYGFQVTLIERAPTVRMGGYPIDLRGTAIRVADKMGILASLRAAHIQTKWMKFMDGDGGVLAVVKPEDMTGGVEGFDVEVPRWNLSSVLYEATRESVDYRFNQSIVAINEVASGVDVTFQNGRAEAFDIVIGADGLHSNTRKVVFGPEAPFIHYLGYTFAGFTIPRITDLDQEIAAFGADNRFAVLYAVRNLDRLFAFFVLRRPYPSDEEMKDVGAQRRMMHDAFAGDGWRIPEMLLGLDNADDVFCDTVSQIRMPTWSAGRVALVGDAAYGPSFMTGQGSSMALVGAYILAGELASYADHRVAFARYEQIARKFVEDNQSTAKRDGWQFIPNSIEELEQHRRKLAEAMRRAGPDESALAKRQIHNSLELLDYPIK